MMSKDPARIGQRDLVAELFRDAAKALHAAAQALDRVADASEAQREVEGAIQVGQKAVAGAAARMESAAKNGYRPPAALKREVMAMARDFEKRVVRVRAIAITKDEKAIAANQKARARAAKAPAATKGGESHAAARGKPRKGVPADAPRLV